MYGSLPSFVFGFHGCDKAGGLEILNGNQELSITKSWGWLSASMCFLEHDTSQTYECALKRAVKKSNK